MNQPTRKHLGRSECARAVLAVVRACPMAVCQLAWVLRERFRPATVAGEVRTLARAGQLCRVGFRRAWPATRPVTIWGRI